MHTEGKFSSGETDNKKEKLKETLETNHQILDALASKDKKELRKCGYVAYNDIIEFPKPVAYTIKRLKEIIKDVEKAKLKGNSLMCGIMIEIPMSKELKKLKLPKGKKCFKVKSIRQKWEDTK